MMKINLINLIINGSKDNRSNNIAIRYLQPMAYYRSSLNS